MSDTLEDVPQRTLASPLPRVGEDPSKAGALGGRRKRIVIVGGGFAGIAAARALRRSDADVILIDRRNHHIFQPLLYQAATAVLAPSEIAALIRQLEARQANLNVMLSDVVDVDSIHRTIDAFCPGIGIRKVRFDFFMVAAGTR